MLDNNNTVKFLNSFGKVSAFILFLIYTIFTFGPVLWVLTMSLKSTDQIRKSPYMFPASPRFKNYLDVWVSSNYKVYFLNSAFVVGFSIIFLIIIGSMAAYCFAKLPFRGSNQTFLIVFSTIMLPAQVLLIPLFKLLVSYKLYNTLFGLGTVYIAVQLPLTIYVLRSFFAAIPKELNEAARIDGCSEWKTFWKIMFPIAVPAISTILIVNFVQLWNEFIYAVIFIQDETKRTLPLGIMKFVGDAYEDLGSIAAGLIISIIPIVVLYIAFSDQFIKGMSSGAVKG